ncbi:MAG: winged helix-turn-helix domain-containing protein [Candidatus Woesearchaeota archaeon]|jgi:predicted transcriptional regulator
MIKQFIRITLIKEVKPGIDNINSDLQWFCNTLGMFNLRDKEKSCYRLFVELLKAARLEKEMSSDDLADRLNLTRATVIHHLNSLIASGLVIAKEDRYYLRVNNLKELVDFVEKDVISVFKDLKDVAENIDDKLELD